MSRRSFFLALGIFLFLVVGAGVALFVLVRYERQWFAQAALPAGSTRTQRSQDFLEEFTALFSDIANGRDWCAQFTDEQMNSYFEEDFVQSGVDKGLLPEGISQPRVLFEPGKIRLGFRYGSGAWSTIISIDLHVWLVAGEPNAVALEVEGFHAGALPISAQSLLESVAEVGRLNGIDVNWYRYNAHPTAVLRFQTDPHSTLQLQAVHLSQGTLRIQGHSAEPSSHVVLQPAEAAPRPAGE
jgi:hypothetical protein